MTARFVDTNVLIYASTALAEHGAKTASAREILAGSDIAVSVQVLQEFYVQATRPNRGGRLSHAEAAASVARLARLPVQSITPELVQAAIRTCQRFQISYWDAAIIEAARRLGCHTVLSEDLSDGQDYDGVRVRNPFA